MVLVGGSGLGYFSFNSPEPLTPTQVVKLPAIYSGPFFFSIFFSIFSAMLFSNQEFSKNEKSSLNFHFYMKNRRRKRKRKRRRRRKRKFPLPLPALLHHILMSTIPNQTLSATPYHTLALSSISNAYATPYPLLLVQVSQVSAPFPKHLIPPTIPLH